MRARGAPNEEFRVYNHVYLAGTPTPHPQAPTPRLARAAHAAVVGVQLRTGWLTGFPLIY